MDTHLPAKESPERSLDDVDGLRRKRRAREQEWLLPYENPLHRRFDREFFARIPRTPGVYFMHGTSGELLYVGKAKNLRARLRSYRQAKPDAVSRKVIRLVNRIAEIRWEECASEQAALLRENQLLREHRPPYNVVNTSPESYYFIALHASDRTLRFYLTTAPDLDSDLPGLELFGAFKGRRSIREGYSALLRLLWACQAELERFQFPSRLCASKPCSRYELPLKPAEDALAEADHRRLIRLLRRFLKGTSSALLTELTRRLLSNDSIPPFCYRVIQDDLELLSSFFDYGPDRNRRLRRAGGIPASTHLIAQEAIDDLIVIDRMRLKMRLKNGN